MDNLIKEKLKEIEEVNSINIRELRGVTIFEVNAKEDQDTHEKIRELNLSQVGPFMRFVKQEDYNVKLEPVKFFQKPINS